MILSSPFTLYKIAFLLLACSFFLTYLLTPLIRKLALRFEILDTPSLERKIHKTPMPLLGGIALFFGFLLTLCFLYLIIAYYFSIGGPYYFVFEDEKDLLWIRVGLYLICSIMILLVGILDDLKSIDFRLKLLVQSLAALIIIFGGTRLNFLPSPSLNVLLSFFWIVSLTNSFNLLDNMNGLSAGLSSIIIGFFIVVSFYTQAYLLTLFLIIPLGCLWGFLPHNFPKARVFLGDCGSLFIGFSLATYSMWIFNRLLQQTSSQWLTLLSLVLMLSIPICDTLTVVIIRLKNKKPIYVGDMNHLSHQLVRRGFSATHSVIILYAGALVVGVAGLLFVL